MFTAVCEFSRINFLMRKHLTRGGSEKPLQRTSNTVWSSGRISPNFCERPVATASVWSKKSYLDCSSDTYCTRSETGKETLWSRKLKNWRRWRHLNSTPEAQCKGSVDAAKKWNLHFPGRIFVRRQRLRTSTLTQDRPEREEQEILQGKSDELDSPTQLEEDSTGES